MLNSDIIKAKQKATTNIMDKIFIKAGIYLLGSEKSIKSLHAHLNVNHDALSKIIELNEHCFELKLRNGVTKENCTDSDLFVKLSDEGVRFLRSKLLYLI